ncbi:MAG TPA: asparagine synthase (glutamine-hydrolyzing) [Candidatus Bathyarchaeia archaeon]|nr:asparagine synthase (glutamine-hydrolyzing) [Candidatus Bathyarchaeia archaeon]
MCGIAGLWAPSAGRDIWRLAAPLGPALRHRGPDDAGWLAAWPREGRTCAARELEATRSDADVPPEVILAHRRLSIVDLTTGWQPLSNEARDVWIVYNGEIYNHLALRAELEALGHRFATRSDTEMVVHAYEAWGTEAFAKFNGIFAFALWDGRRRRLLVARDPLGVKPLYVGHSAKGLWFASEVKAAIAAGLGVPEVDRQSLELFLTYRFVPSPATLLRGVRRVPPGHWLQADDGSGWSAPRRYAPPPKAEDRRPSREEWVERLVDATRAAVRGQLMADVPVGALLSGGLDSSIVVACMGQEASSAVWTYGIGFPEPGRESELDVARRAADALGTDHHEVTADHAGFFGEWADTLGQLDEPVATPGHVLVRMLCRRVGRDLKVALTGQGADEPLGGYLRHTPERWSHVLAAGPVAAAARLGARLLPRREAVRRFAAVASEPDVTRRIAAAFAVFAPDQVAALLGSGGTRVGPSDVVLEPVRRWLDGTQHLDSLNRLLYVDARLSLADDLLLGSDKVSMAHSVEARVPFLDLDYLAVAESIPARVKMSLLRGRKSLQHLVARRTLPAGLARALTAPGSGWRRKRGFDLPIGRWFAPDRLPAVEDLLIGKDAALPEYVRRDVVAQMLEEQRRRSFDRTRALTALLTLEVWHRAFVRGNPAEVARIGVDL